MFDHTTCIALYLNFHKGAVKLPCCESYSAAAAIQPAYNRRFYCTGNEDDLSQCTVARTSTISCNHSGAESVICGKSQMVCGAG